MLLLWGNDTKWSAPRRSSGKFSLSLIRNSKIHYLNNFNVHLNLIVWQLILGYATRVLHPWLGRKSRLCARQEQHVIILLIPHILKENIFPISCLGLHSFFLILQNIVLLYNSTVKTQ